MPSPFLSKKPSISVILAEMNKDKAAPAVEGPSLEEEAGNAAMKAFMRALADMDAPKAMKAFKEIMDICDMNDMDMDDQEALWLPQ